MGVFREFPQNKEWLIFIESWHYNHQPVLVRFVYSFNLKICITIIDQELTYSCVSGTFIILLSSFLNKCAYNLAPNFSLYEFIKTKYLCTKTRQNATPIFEVVGSMFPNTRKNVGENLESTTMNQLLHQKRIYNPPLKDSIRLLWICSPGFLIYEIFLQRQIT